jgi:hypothetical protein
MLDFSMPERPSFVLSAIAALFPAALFLLFATSPHEHASSAHIETDRDRFECKAPSLLHGRAATTPATYKKKKKESESSISNSRRTITPTRRKRNGSSRGEKKKKKNLPERGVDAIRCRAVPTAFAPPLFTPTVQTDSS